MTLTDWIDEASLVEYEDYDNQESFKVGALAAAEKLSAMGVEKFDEQKAHNGYFADRDDVADIRDTRNFVDGAEWQHKRTSALLAARDEKLDRLTSEVSYMVSKEIEYGSRWLSEIQTRDERIKKAEDLLRDLHKRFYHSQISDYFSEQAKGGDHVE